MPGVRGAAPAAAASQTLPPPPPRTCALPPATSTHPPSHLPGSPPPSRPPPPPPPAHPHTRRNPHTPMHAHPQTHPHPAPAGVKNAMVIALDDDTQKNSEAIGMPAFRMDVKVRAALCMLCCAVRCGAVGCGRCCVHVGHCVCSAGWWWWGQQGVCRLLQCARGCSVPCGLPAAAVEAPPTPCKAPAKPPAVWRGSAPPPTFHRQPAAPLLHTPSHTRNPCPPHAPAPPPCPSPHAPLPTAPPLPCPCCRHLDTTTDPRQPEGRGLQPRRVGPQVPHHPKLHEARLRGIPVGWVRVGGGGGCRGRDALRCGC